MTKPAIFLDRDGTLNVEKNYLHKIADWEFTPRAAEAICAFIDAGYRVVVVSNQSGIARGMYDAAAVDTLHKQVNALLEKQGAYIDAYYYCPHHLEFGGQRECDCRKPLPGLLLKAQKNLAIDLSRSWMIGDKASDIEAGLAAGVKPLLVLTGYGAREQAGLDASIPRCADLFAAAQHILAI